MKRTALLFAAAWLIVAAAACSDDDGSGAATDTGVPATDLTLMLNWTPNTHHLGVYVAEQRGWYDEAGLDLRIIEPGEGGVNEAVASGRADVGISVAEEVLPARAAGVPVVSIAAILPINDSSLMALGDSGITRPRDLEGKTYGGYGGALETELITRLIECDGGDPSRLRMVEVGDVDYLAGMERGTYDVVWVFSGWDALRATAVEGRTISEIRFADHVDCIPNWYTPVFVASESAIAERSDVLRSFLAATARGYAAAAEQPEEAASDFLAAVPEADPALVKASADYYAGLFSAPDTPWGEQELEVWTSFGIFADEAGLLSEPVDPSKAFTNALLPPSG